MHSVPISSSSLLSLVFSLDIYYQLKYFPNSQTLDLGHTEVSRVSVRRKQFLAICIILFCTCAICLKKKTQCEACEEMVALVWVMLFVFCWKSLQRLTYVPPFCTEGSDWKWEKSLFAWRYRWQHAQLPVGYLSIYKYFK